MEVHDDRSLDGVTDLVSLGCEPWLSSHSNKNILGDVSFWFRLTYVALKNILWDVSFCVGSHPIPTGN